MSCLGTIDSAIVHRWGVIVIMAMSRMMTMTDGVVFFVVVTMGVSHPYSYYYPSHRRRRNQFPTLDWVEDVLLGSVVVYSVVVVDRHHRVLHHRRVVCRRMKRGGWT